MRTYHASKLAIWRTKLPHTKHAILPPHDGRPNPLVTRSRLYVSVFSPGAVLALDRRTGRVLWRRELGRFAGPSVYLHSGILFAKTANELCALNPDSGDVFWRFCPYGMEVETIYSSPYVHGKRIYIGDRRGFLHCLDASTGRPLWRRLTNREENDDVNATATSIGHFVVTATNARTALAYEARSGHLAWRSRLDSPAGSGLFLHLGSVVVITDSIYLLDPRTGKIRRSFSWPGSCVVSATSTGDDLFAVVGHQSSPGNSYVVVTLGESKILYSANRYPYYCWLRYVPESGLVYLSHFGGIDLLAKDAPRPLGRIRFNWITTVDVKDRLIYALTERGSVYALRHPKP